MVWDDDNLVRVPNLRKSGRTSEYKIISRRLQLDLKVLLTGHIEGMYSKRQLCLSAGFL